MDYNAPYILRSACKVPFLRPVPNVVQIALFLLYIPIFAAPLEALAVLGTLNGVGPEVFCYIETRICVGWHPHVLHYPTRGIDGPAEKIS